MMARRHLLRLGRATQRAERGSSRGVMEERLGVYATKVGYDIYDEAAATGAAGRASSRRLRAEVHAMAVERCLERLETDRIDVLQ